MRAPRWAKQKALFAAPLLVGALLATADAPASGAVVLNEVRSEGGPDFIEVTNTGPAAVDLSGYVLKDSNNGNSFTVPPGTSLAVGGFYSVDVPFGLGSGDAARLFAPGDVLLDTYTWSAHAAATYGRCPDGTGAFTWTVAATPGAANACPGPASPWPGAAAVALGGELGVYGSNLSGLAYQPSGSAATGVLWAVRNGPSTLFRLVLRNGVWTRDTANGWANGKQLLFPDGTGVPDAESVTLVGGDPSGVFVSIERNDSGGLDGISRPGVLRYDASSPAATLTATREWNLVADLPGLDSNAGLEAVTWVPDDALVAKGLVDVSTGGPYDPANHPGHGSGLFLVGVEQDGRILAYALNQSTGTFTRVASFASGFPKIMALEYEPETALLWAVCDDSCTGRSATLDVARTGADAGRFAVTAIYERPAGMANLNNEGFAIAPQSECANGLKPVFWADDSTTAGHAIRSGALRCTVPAAPGTTPPVVTTPPQTPPATSPPVGSPPAVRPPATRPTDRVKPVVSRLRASRRTVSFRLSEAGRVTVTVERRSGKRYKKVKAFTVSTKAGTRTISFAGRVSAAKLRRGRLRISVVVTDAAGNRSATTRKTVGG